MDIDQLKEFVVFARYLNFNSAARNLHIAESTLSKHISAMERETGIALISHGKSPEITPAGMLFLESASEIVSQYSYTLKQCKNKQLQHQGVVNIEDQYKLVACFDDFIHSNTTPTVLVSLHGKTPTEALLEGSIDVAVAYSNRSQDDAETYFENAGYLYRYIGREPTALLMRKDNPLAAKETISLVDLQNFSILSDSCARYSLWDDVFRDTLDSNNIFMRYKVRPFKSSLITGLADEIGESVVYVSQQLCKYQCEINENFIMRTISDVDTNVDVYLIALDTRADEPPLQEIFLDEISD